jgi:hypothetical protein
MTVALAFISIKDGDILTTDNSYVSSGDGAQTSAARKEFICLDAAVISTRSLSEVCDEALLW